MYVVTREDVESFWKSVDPSAALPNYLRTHAGRFADLATRVRAMPPGARLVDIGGTPRTKRVISHFSNCEEYVLTPQIDLEIDQWAPLVGERYFDIALCTEVIEHMSADPALLLQQANTVLKLGGVLILTTVNIARRASFYNLAKGLAPYKMGEVFGARGDRHHREYAPYELQLLVAANGFKVNCETKDLYTTTPHDRAAAAWVQQHVSGLDEVYLGDTIIITATKIEHLVEPARIYPVYHKSMCDNSDGKIDASILERCPRTLNQ